MRSRRLYIVISFSGTLLMNWDEWHRRCQRHALTYCCGRNRRPVWHVYDCGCVWPTPQATLAGGLLSSWLSGEGFAYSVTGPVSAWFYERAHWHTSRTFPLLLKANMCSLEVLFGFHVCVWLKKRGTGRITCVQAWDYVSSNVQPPEVLDGAGKRSRVCCGSVARRRGFNSGY